ncbi:MAG: hypothetical protein ACREK4_06380, partial [Candidatus Rokuibacteriota bacterium]
LWAIAAGFRDSDSEALAICELGTMVDRLAGQRTLVYIPATANGQETTIGAHAPVALRDWLVARYPRSSSRVPSVDQIASLLDLHAKQRQRGRKTTARIVTDIMLAMRVHGATANSDATKLLRRVDRYLWSR